MIEVIETVWIEMPDGTQLAARLWLPEGARKEPVPCILEYIPYRRRDRTRLRDEAAHPLFAAAGYAAIRVDQRGSGDSEGVMTDEYTHTETQDGVDVIAWIAAQDWCDGNVGMFGKSWGAYNSFQVAARRPPALKAIAPVMGTDDRWLEDIHFYGGVLASDNFWWGSIMQLYNAMPPDPEIVGEERWRGMWKERLEAMRYWPAQWLEHQTRDAMWWRGSISENYEDVQIPVYFFGGWADLFRDTPFRLAENLECPLKVIIGPWAHLYPHEAVPGPKIDFIAELIRFWDHTLKGIDNGLMDEAPLRFYLQDSIAPSGYHAMRPGRWVEERSWPSPDVRDRILWLNAGTLGAEPEAGATMSVRSPQTFGSSGGDMCSFAIPGDLPADCRIDAAGAMCFRMDPAAEALDILGQPRLRLRLAADRAQGFVAALLIDEAPDGGQNLISRGFANLMHRKSDSAPEAVAPGEVMEITVPLHGIGYRLAAGHRLTVQIASAYWPILWPSPKAVGLAIEPGSSHLALPLRAKDKEDCLRPLPAPAARAGKRPLIEKRKGSMERSLRMDLASGEVCARFFLDGGVFGPVGRVQLTDTGTEMGDISDRIYRIRADDPLSCVATMNQQSVFERGRWRVRIETTAEMRATETDFLIKASVTCFDGDERFHHVDWEHAIPRNGM
ncbi:MAG: CocE/NonD family hydrolase [Ectothiorhodospiraceae bacterium AqS1]|nr:CocE/NonD family hydrolase [Ectothiorhodospiraceae bacterium AqS1]